MTGCPDFLGFPAIDEYRRAVPAPKVERRGCCDAETAGSDGLHHWARRVPMARHNSRIHGLQRLALRGGHNAPIDGDDFVGAAFDVNGSLVEAHATQRAAALS